MKLKLLFCLFLSSSSFAQSNKVAMDNLLNISDKNYCLNNTRNDFKNISDYFNLNEKSVVTIAGLEIKESSLNYPTVATVNTGEAVAKEIIKNEPKKYNMKDISISPIKNSYIMKNNIDFRLDEPPGVVMNKISNQYKGLSFKKEGLMGGYLFQPSSPINLDGATNIIEFNKNYDKIIEGNLYFEVSPLVKGPFKGGSVLSYVCTVSMVSGLSAQEIAGKIKGKIVPPAVLPK